ncbi:hypothetical protein CC78DRAFT_587068 [Lojkania enalia]|uniref:Rhodopsin domain-containing protein n=1 Tax=Lojkania enalia TaxID=147567 RepID=A0A9P4N4M3_9PLEO|nr:hypothetical protein CC78DRAFT_587068 [Didymosphaeria enalia]
MVDDGRMFNLDPKFALSAQQSRLDLMVAISAVMTAIGMACVGLRVYTRACIVRNMGIEDWTMIAAAFLTLVFMSEIIAGATQFKMGFSGILLDVQQMQSAIQNTLAIIMVYKLIVTLIKVSILFIYLRLAIDKTFEKICKGTVCLLMTWEFIVIIVVPAQCRPLHKLWDFTGEVQGSCINSSAFYLATSTFHVIMDVWILAIPLRLVKSIPKPTQGRLALFFIFGLGVFSTIASIVRLYYLRVFTISDDPFYESMPINTWSIVEVNVGIVCASLPTLRPLFSKQQRNRTREALNKGQSKQGSGNGVIGQFITLHATEMSISSPSVKSFASTMNTGKTSTTYEQYELNDRPPPVPPKD